MFKDFKKHIKIFFLILILFFFQNFSFSEENFWGHGRGYYRRKDLPEMYETFANCFQAYDTPAWPKVQKYFPRTAARFEEILEEFNRTGDITFDEFGT